MNKKHVVESFISPLVVQSLYCQMHQRLYHPKLVTVGCSYGSLFLLNRDNQRTLGTLRMRRRIHARAYCGGTPSRKTSQRRTPRPTAAAAALFGSGEEDLRVEPTVANGWTAEIGRASCRERVCLYV